MANTFGLGGGQTILSHPIVVQTILPFILVFAIVFAVLQKSKILGEKAKQIDAIVALVVGLLIISFAQATGIILQLMPFLAVSLVVILVIMLLIGSLHPKDAGITKWMGHVNKGLIIIIILAVVIAMMSITDSWNWIYDLFAIGSDNGWVANILFIVIIGAAVWAVSRTIKSEDKGKDG